MPYTQNGPFKVTSQLGTDALLFSALYGEEAVSTPFVFTVDMLSETQSIEASEILRKPLVVELDMDGSTRYIHGLVRRFTELDIAYGTLYGYRAEIVPWLWFLSLAADCRVYQNMSVLDIVEDVFKRNNWTDFSVQTTGSYSKREYCVQYRETDLAFVNRLLQEEGIFYFFQHTADKHTLVLADSNSAFQQTPGPQTVTTVQKVVGSTEYENNIGNLSFDQQVPPGTVTLYDYNYLDGQTPLKATESSTGPEEVYDYPGGFTDQQTGETYARLRLDAVETLESQLSGAGTCRGFTSGYQFSISDYFRNDLNGTWNITRVRHTAQLGSYVGSDTGQQTARYVNDFTAIAESVVFRPLVRTPRPIVYGTQTALVVGPSGSEINVDKYGRVQVQFFWERADKGDPGSSCWVRVATFWAGKQWGAIHIPRIGQEVIVAFEEGNPDRPIIVGSVYNPDMMPPYDLPANKSQSGIKSRSTEGGGTSDYNEFRFEDKMGSEEILLHAQKNFTVEVENDRSTYIGDAETKVIDKGDYTETLNKGSYTLEIQEGDQTIGIDKGDQTTLVAEGDCTLMVQKGDNSISVAQGNFDISVNNNLSTVVEQGNENKTLVKGNQSTFLGEGNHSTVVGQGDFNLNVQLGTISINASLGEIKMNAMQGITLQCGANSIQITPTGINISGMQVQISGQVETQVSGLMTTVSGSAMTQISGAITMIG